MITQKLFTCTVRSASTTVVKGDHKIKKRGQHRIPTQAATAHTAGGNHMVLVPHPPTKPSL